MLLYSTTITLPTEPYQTIVTHYMRKSSPGWAEGFLTSSTSFWLSGVYAETVQDWTQDDEFITDVKNPRVTYSEKKLKGTPDLPIRTEYTYAAATDYSGNVKEVREFTFAGALRRKTVFNYRQD